MDSKSSTLINKLNNNLDSLIKINNSFTDFNEYFFNEDQDYKFEYFAINNINTNVLSSNQIDVNKAKIFEGDINKGIFNQINTKLFESDNLCSSYGNIRDFFNQNLNNKNLKSEFSYILDLKNKKGEINNFTSCLSNIKELKNENGNINSLTSDFSKIKTLENEKGLIYNLKSKDIKTKNFESENGFIEFSNSVFFKTKSLESNEGTINDFNSVNAKLKKLTATNFNISSDIKLKKDIKPINLSQFYKLNPVEFTYKDTEKKSYGFIAQDVEKIYPELIEEVDGIKRVDYIAFIGILCAKIQELEKKIQTTLPS